MGKKPRKNRQTKVEPQPQVEQPQKISFWYKIFPPALLGMVTAAFYHSSLKYPFQFDDIANITKKFDIRFSNPLSQWLHNRRWMGEWLNRLNFDWGRFDPFYYRLTNLIVHIATGILVYFVILEGCSYLKKRPFFSKNALYIALTTASLFLLHPVQTQAVSYVIQARLEGLATLFVMATILLFLKAFQTQNKILRYALLPLFYTIGFVSCGTKEIAIVSPFLIMLVDWFFIAQEDWTSFKSRIWVHASFSLLIFGTFLHYLSAKFVSDIARLKFVTANNRGNILTENAHDLIRPLSFLISEFKVILHYLFMYLLPARISVEYDWKLSESFFAPDSFFPFLALCVIFSLAIYSLIKRKYSFFGFGVLWFFITIAPRSTIIPSPELVCDYKAYLPSVGWLFVIATCSLSVFNFVISKMRFLPKWFFQPIVQIALFVVWAFPLGYTSMQRNLVWSSTVEFWKDITEKAPKKARGHNNLGVALSEGKKYDEAIPHFLEAIRLDRFYSDPWSNLAVAYSVKNQEERAIAALKEAIRLFPNYPEAYNNLGTLLIKRKKLDQAERVLEAAIKLRPYYGKAYFNLGRLYIDRGNNEKAWVYFKKATEGDLDTKEGFFTLGQISLNLKKFDEAINAFEMTLKLGGNMPIEQKVQVLFKLANACFLCKKLDRAEQIFTQLCKLNPNDHRYIYNLGETLYTKNDFEKACKVFEKLSNPPFSFAQANFRYASCLEKQNRHDEAKNALNRIVEAKTLPEDVRKMADKEIGRISVQQKINSGNCTLTMKDIQQAFKR